MARHRLLRRSGPRPGRRQDGSIGIAFIATTLVTVGFIGIAVDISFARLNASSLQAAADFAALAGAAEPTVDHEQRKDVARRVFNANMAGQSEIDVTRLSIHVTDAHEVIIKAEAEIKPSIMKVFGVGTVELDAESTAAIIGNPVEIAIAMDTTASMTFGRRWEDGTEAIARMLDAYKAASGGHGFRASFVPFSDRVNTGRTFLHILDPSISLNGFQGCTEPREELIDGNPYRLTTRSHHQIPFVPSVRDTWGELRWMQANGRHRPVCPNREIVAYEENTEVIRRTLEAVQPGGTGRFDVGFVWAHRLLDATWHETFGVLTPWDWEDYDRLAILVTDGNTVAYDYEVGAGDSLGYNKGTHEGFEQVVWVCDQMKADGIEVHMIFILGNEHAIPYMQACASEGGYHEVQDIDGLIDAFNRIGRVNGMARLVK